MALYLADLTFDGEPIGIWNDAGNSYYVPGNENAQARAERTIKSYSLPWSVLTAKLEDSMNHRSWWQILDTPLELEPALAQLRSEYFAEQSEQTLPEK